MKYLIQKQLAVTAIILLSTTSANAESYPAKISAKLSNGFANVATGVAEIPKTMILKTAQKGPLYGLTMGFVTGMGHMAGRTLLGVADMVTFPWPTKPIMYPHYVWKRFDKETRYSKCCEMR